MNNNIYVHSTHAQTTPAQQWFDLYNWLLPLIKQWVWNAGVPLWQGQQQDIAEDIALEAVARTFSYHQLSQCGKVPSITMLKPFSRTVAHNYFHDRRRKDHRVTRMLSPYMANESSSYDPGQIAIEHLVLQSTIRAAALTIAKLPPRQKAAVLKDLANACSSEENAGILEQALAEHGIQLSSYQGPPSNDPAERKREAVLRYVAYQRLKKMLGC